MYSSVKNLSTLSQIITQLIGLGNKIKTCQFYEKFSLHSGTRKQDQKRQIIRLCFILCGEALYTVI